MKGKSILFLVPARGGSKGLPRKNLTPFAGRPLITYILEAARAAVRKLEQYQCRLVVSTDDAEIASVARRSGAETPFMRPAELARDESLDIEALLHALDWLKDREGYVPEILVELQAPSPLTSPEDICGAIRIFLEGEGKPVFTVSPSERPPYWACELKEGMIELCFARPEGAVRRQDFPATYYLNGAVSVISPKQLYRDRAWFAQGARAYVMPPERSVDIDTLFDLELAETLYFKGKARGASECAVMKVSGRTIGSGYPCFIIAEAGVNHNGDEALAHQLVDRAADSGADAVKFQTFQAERLVTPSAPKETYQMSATRTTETQLEMLKSLELSADAHRALKAHAEARGLIFLSTPFDEDSADFLESLGVTALKVGSGEVTHLPLLRHLARKGRPIFLSTGMSHLGEVAEAVETIQSNGNPSLALLHCVSCYPADPADCNLNAIHMLKRTFCMPVGFSDHTLGWEVSIAAVSLGACVIEKHLTLDKNLPGPDHRASLEPSEFEALVRNIRNVESALQGNGAKQPRPSEFEGRLLGRRSLCAAVDIQAGEKISREMIAILRPGTGIPPSELDAWVGRKAPMDFPCGSLLRED